MVRAREGPTSSGGGESVLSCACIGANTSVYELGWSMETALRVGVVFHDVLCSLPGLPFYSSKERPRVHV